jgi:serine/threonine protein kinase
MEESQYAVATVPHTAEFDAIVERFLCVNHSTLLLPSMIAMTTTNTAKLYLPQSSGAVTLLAALSNTNKPLANMFLQLKVALDVATALRMAHARGVAHGNIRPEHVLVTSFRFDNVRFDGSTPDNATLLGCWPGLFAASQKAGTPYFAAPETTADSAPTFESDVYSLGMLLYALISGMLPFSDLRKEEYENVRDMEAKIRAGARPTLATQALSLLPGDVHRLLNDCWAALPEKRPTVREVVRRLYNVIAGYTEPALPLPSSLPRIMQLLETGRPRGSSACSEMTGASLDHAARPAPPSTAPPPPLPEHPAPPQPPTAAAPAIPTRFEKPQNTLVLSVTSPSGGSIKIRISRANATVEHVKKLAC